jgi:membrane protease YdiL (CAAX protease family)
VQYLVLALLLAAIFGFFVPAVQRSVPSLFQHHPWTIWGVPFLLTAVFDAAALLVGAASPQLTILVLIYTAGPVLCAVLAGPGGHQPHALDFVGILLLWLPLEFAAGATLIPLPARGFLHSTAYGIAILLGLLIFLAYRALPGLKYNLPRAKSDYWLPLAGFAIAAPVLILVGVAIGFIPPPHAPVQPAGKMAAAIGLIFAGTALPEEILFRALIQNFMMQRFGSTTRTLLAASFIFGCAHLDNGPQPLPNWRYMIVATIAGVAYGKVFAKSNTLLSSATLHMLVDWTKHFFF